MKWYFDQTPQTGRKMVVGPYDDESSATAMRNMMEQNMVAARAKDPQAPLYAFGAAYQEADDWLQKQPRCYARIVKQLDGVDREYMVYTDGTEELVPLEG